MGGAVYHPIYVAAARTSHIGLDQSFICPFQRSLLSTLHVPGPGLDSGVAVESKASKAATLMKPTFSKGKQADSKQFNIRVEGTNLSRRISNNLCSYFPPQGERT